MRIFRCILPLVFLASSAAGAAPVTLCGSASAAGGAALPEAWRASLVPVRSHYAWGREVLSGRPEGEPVAAGGDATGRYCLEAPGPGVWKVVVTAPGFVPMSRLPLSPVEDVELPPVTLVPDSGARVVARTAAGGAAAGARVLGTPADPRAWAAGDGWRPATRIVRCGPDGEARLPRAEGETLDLYAFRDGVLDVAKARTGASAILVLPPPGTARVVEIRDRDGQPLGGVVIELADHGWPVAITGDDGRATLSGGGPGAVPLILETADGRRRAADLAPASGAGGPARFELPKPATVRSRVVAAAGGGAVAGALVWLGADAGRFTFTGPDGGYSIATGGRERFWLQAAAAGYLPRLAEVGPANAAAGRAPALALERADAVAGSVVDESGAPLAGVTVTAAADSAAARLEAYHPDSAVGRARSDADGRFVVSGLRTGGVYELAAGLDGFARATGTAAPGARGARAVRLVLRRMRAAHGRVVDRGERPLAGVEVTLRPAAAGAPVTVRTGPDGGFRIAAAPAPRFDLVARGNGLARLILPGIEPPAGTAPVDLGTLVMAPAAHLAGRVTGPGGEPLAGAEIRVQPAAGPPSPSRADRRRQEPPAAVTGADGRFRIEELAAGRPVDLLTTREGHLPAWTVGAEPPTEAPVTIELEAASRLSGRVVDEEELPVAGATVHVHRRGPPAGTVGVEPRGEPGAREAVTDAGGRFEIDGTAAGALEVVANADDYLPGEPVTVEAPPGGERSGVRLVLRRGAVIEGLVRGPGGEPIAGASVRAASAAASSDAEGFYRLGGVAPGLLGLRASHRDYRRLVREVDVEPGVNRVDLDLEPGWTVTGRTVDPRGAAVAGAEVELRTVGVRPTAAYGTVSDGDGRFRIVVSGSGRYRVSAARRGWVPGEAELRVDSTVEAVEVTLSPGASVEGRLLGLELDELAAVTVEARRPGAGAQAGAVDHRSRYAVSGLAPGDWEVRATLAGGRREARATVTVAPGEQRVERDLEFGGGARLTGRLLYEGEPVPAAHVSLEGLTAAGRRDTVTAHDGGFVLDDLTPGRYRLDVLDPSRALSHVEEIELTADRHMVLELESQPLTGTVVADDDGTPVPEALVFLRQLAATDGGTGSLISVGCDLDGRFTIGHVAPGYYQVTARKNGFTPAETAIEVAAGAPPEPVLLRLSRAGGLELLVQRSTGGIPPLATVAVFDPAGRMLLAETRGLGSAGGGYFQQVPAGEWSLLVSAPGAAPAWITATVPGPEVPVTLPPAAPLEVRVPALIGSGTVAELTLGGPGGRPWFEIVPGGEVRSRWSLADGLATIADLPAGTWTVQVRESDGTVRTGGAVTDGLTPAVVSLE